MKILSAQTDLGNATSVSNASVVRVFNSDSSNLLVTRKTSGGTTIGSFMVPTGEVVYCEKDYTDTLEASADVKASKTAFSPMMSFVGQTSDSLPTYTVSLSATSIDEGGSFTTTLTTTNVDDGTSFNYILSGTGIAPADFSSGSLTGSVTISNNTASFSHTLSEDATTEGTETITIRLIDSSLNYVGNTVNVNVADTSTTPAAPPAGSGNTYSVHFDGTDDVLSLADHADLQIGSSTYTMEFWVYKNADTPDNWDVWAGKGSNSNSTREWAIESMSDQSLEWWYDVGNGSSWSNVEVASSIPTSTWTHICAQKDSNGYFSFFVDGTRTYYSTTGAQTLNIGADEFCIGGWSDPSYITESNVKISNFRFIKGTALYGSSLTPSTEPLTNVTNTKLLCCNKSTVTGSTVTTGTITAVGAPQSSTDTPFGQPAVNFISTGLSAGTGESLTIASDSSLDLGSGAFTIEAWVKMNSSQGSAWNVLAASSGYLFGTGVSSYNIYVRGTDGLRIYESSGGPGENWTNTFINDSMFNNSSWTHIAWTRVSNGNNTSNNNNTIWINGVGQGSFSNRENSFDDGQKLFLGASDYNQNGTATQYGFDGSISNFRLTKGQALYTSNFTPSTVPLSTTSQGATASNVSVLGFQTQGSITSFTKSPSTPTVIGTPTSTTGPF
tara:strand:+ start:179 stop:2182 length:2004 start_codon:yes stop_codon:yes gene_type:complete